MLRARSKYRWLRHVCSGCLTICVAACSADAPETHSSKTPVASKIEVIRPTEPHKVVLRDLYLRNPSPLSEQVEAGFKPRKDLPAHPISLPVNWSEDPFKDPNWRFQLNAWRMLDPYFKRYFNTKDPAFLDDALAYIRDWHKFHVIDGRPNDYAWYDMAKGIRGLYIAFYLSAHQQEEYLLSVSDKAMLLELAELHIETTHKIGITDSNHGIFQIAGLSLICQVLTEEDFCIGELDYARQQAESQMALQFTKAGIHKENSPSYHFFTRNIVESLPAFKSVVATDDLAAIKANGPWFVFPNKRIAAVGDSAGNTRPLQNDLHITCLAESECYSVAPFEADGYAIIRDLPSQQPDSMLFVTGMAHGTVHAHLDALSFELMEFGRMIFIDSGKYGYKVDDNRRYVVSAAAHNTISLSNQTLDVNDMKLVGSQLENVTQEDGAFIVRSQAEYTDYFIQSRELTYKPEAFLNITDSLKALQHVSRNRETQFVSSLHFKNDLMPTLMENGFEVIVGNHRVIGTLETTGCQISLSRGQKNPLLGWESVGYQKMTPTSVVQASCDQAVDKISWTVEFKL